ncbi:pseudoazurin [Chelativorans sp. ZYF759]|uniref:pseudoazurin n=1 Tax=Chelativorans sp. ZYF759 TaxID=2692213 RepID=UPI00145C678B|nr:pseudoazurin [Chelativorans sp. ZYF759]NMG38183.1 pseudoazurin [Chelativorans sp. ZYF759]
MKRSLALIALAAGLALSGAAHAVEHEIKMLNRGERPMVFEPEFLRAEPGDTLRFVAVDPGHNAETIPGMLPEGAEPFKGTINQEIVYTLTEEGIYGIKCLPHYGMGMVMLVVVGEPLNLEEAKEVRHPGRARNIFEDLLTQVD